MQITIELSADHVKALNLFMAERKAVDQLKAEDGETEAATYIVEKQLEEFVRRQYSAVQDSKDFSAKVDDVQVAAEAKAAEAQKA